MPSPPSKRLPLRGVASAGVYGPPLKAEVQVECAALQTALMRTDTRVCGASFVSCCCESCVAAEVCS